MIELPKAFKDQMAEELGAELPAFFDAMQSSPVRALRFNEDKLSTMSEITSIGLVPWERTGCLIPLDSDAGMHPLHEAGAWYLQEPAAMLPVAVLDPQPGERILDLCAAPGGKSTQISARMQNEGVLISNEPIPKRAQILSRNLERMGACNAIVICAYPQQLT